MRVVIAMLKHETNSFSPVPADLARFEAWGCRFGAAAHAAMAGTRMPMAAYIELARRKGAAIATPVAAEAMPSGPVTRAAYERLTGAILEEVERGCDAALLDLHGAMIAEHTDDGEGTLLAAIRARAPGLPIAVTCDLHANVTPAMIDNATALIGYKTYPHVDLYEVAHKVGTILFDALEGRAAPVMAWGRVPLLSHTLRQATDEAPMREAIAEAVAAEAEPAVLAASAFGGFNLGDTPFAGNGAVVIADGDPAAATAARDRILARMWAARGDFVYRGRALADALDEARAHRGPGPVVLLDHADNCGSGGTQDVMGVVQAVLEAGLDGVAMAAILDPRAARAMHAAGPGAALTLPLGGRTDLPALGLKGRPLTLSGTVAALSDGRWTVEGPMYTGVQVDMGPSAVLRVGGMDIVVVSHPHEPWDRGVFTSLGIDPASKRFLLLKSRVHYRAGFGDLEAKRILLDGAGATTSDWTRLPYARLTRPIHPLDEEAAWP